MWRAVMRGYAQILVTHNPVQKTPLLCPNNTLQYILQQECSIDMFGCSVSVVRYLKVLILTGFRSSFPRIAAFWASRWSCVVLLVTPMFELFCKKSDTTWFFDSDGWKCTLSLCLMKVWSWNMKPPVHKRFMTLYREVTGVFCPAVVKWIRYFLSHIFWERTQLTVWW